MTQKIKIEIGASTGYVGSTIEEVIEAIKSDIEVAETKAEVVDLQSELHLHAKSVSVIRGLLDKAYPKFDITKIKVERTAFEAAMSKKLEDFTTYVTVDENRNEEFDGYVNENTQSAWEAWQIARQSNPQSEWFPINDHGFEHGQDVLITDGKEVWSDTVMCDIEGSDHVFYFDNGSDPDYITHWQPFPLPPKE